MPHPANLHPWRAGPGPGKAQPNQTRRIEPGRTVTRYDFRSPRLYVEDALAAGATITLGKKPRRTIFATCCGSSPRQRVLAFNGHDGEWRAALAADGKRRVKLSSGADPEADRTARPALPVRAAQARAARLHGAEGGRDGRVAAAAGADAAHSGQRVNLERMRANAIEAAEQCGMLCIPDIAEPMTFARAHRRPQAGPAAGVLRRGRRGEGPGHGARRRRGRRRPPCCR